MLDSLISFAAVQNSAFNDSNIVGRVLADDSGRAAVEDLLQQQKVIVKALLEENSHLVEALRDALLEHEELIGREITDVLEKARAEHTPTGVPSGAPHHVIDLRDPTSDRA
jgi:cell division protease FtsH